MEEVAVEEKEAFDDVENGEVHHLSIIKFRNKDSNENAVNGCNELEALVVNGYGPPKIMQNNDLIGVEVQQPAAMEMRNNGKAIMSNGVSYGQPKG